MGARWDFYPCQIDDQPASILLDLGLGEGPPPAAADTVYVARARMLDVDRHGMGSADEARVLFGLEDQVTQAASGQGFVYVARVRHAGTWAWIFYAAAGRGAELAGLIEPAVSAAGRTISFREQADPEWGYFRDFLWPEPERLQWMGDRALVDRLVEQGDDLRQPRRVDHWIHFADAASRRAFLAEASELGFALAHESHEPAAALAFGVQIHREDTVQLNAIHATVLLLHELAEAHAGDYDGWETEVLASPPRSSP